MGSIPVAGAKKERVAKRLSLFWGRPHDEPIAASEAELGSHTPLEDRQALHLWSQKILLIDIVYQPMLYFGDKRSPQNVIDAFRRNSIGGIINRQN